MNKPNPCSFPDPDQNKLQPVRETPQGPLNVGLPTECEDKSEGVRDLSAPMDVSEKLRLANLTPKTVSEHLSKSRFFIDQDGDSHWYLVDADKRKEWDEWKELPSDTGGTAWETPFFAEAIDHPNGVVFYGPIIRRSHG